ncbi:MAG: hypothetical protein KC418_06100 [Anaerolineales bacterium]|nr:hypothetical protein [Anaerolineales bacterium]
MARKVVVCILWGLLFAGCAPPTPGTAAAVVSAGATANPVLVATAQADQYWRDAQATATAQQATVAANYRQVEATAQAGTATAAWQATTQAVSIQATEQSLQATGTAQAIALAALASEATLSARASIVAQTATVSAQGTTAAVQATRQAWALAQARSQAQREQIVTAVTTALLIGGVALLAGLLLWLLWRVIPILVTRTGMVRYGQHGNPLLLLQRGGRTVVADPLAMLQAALRVDEYGDTLMPELSPNELQAFLAGGRLQLLQQQAQHAPGHVPQLPAETTTRRRMGPVETEQTVRHTAVPAPIVNLPPSEQLRIDNTPSQPLPGHVSWAQLLQWRGQGLVLGAGAQEMITLDLARTPHLFAAGMTGSGKTRRLLRPLVAQALVRGYHVVLMNESGADFSPFYQQSGVTLVRGGADDYMSVFAAALTEMETRERQLREAGVSEWGRMPLATQTERPPVLLAVDELLALVLLLSPAEQRQFWGLLAAFASRARKVGMGSIGLATDPTYRALGQGGLTYRSQCARVSFRVLQAAGSRALLDEGGAEALEDGQFLALLDRPGVVRGMTANPSDEELRMYLMQYAAPVVSAPTWLALEEGLTPAPAVDEREEQIRELSGQGLSMRAVQQQVFGYVGGKAYDTVKPIYEAVRLAQAG